MIRLRIVLPDPPECIACGLMLVIKTNAIPYTISLGERIAILTEHTSTNACNFAL